MAEQQTVQSERATPNTWTYDAMSRITAETNPLGSFSYAYLDDSVTPITIGGTASGSRTETVTVNGSHTATYVTSASDTLSTIASALSVQINQLGVPGVIASTAGPAISVSAPAGTTYSTTTQGAITIGIGTAFSKGCPRLASIGYPNSQKTRFSWFPNSGNQRLQQISNLDPSAVSLSQFNYGYDAEGQITSWQQQQHQIGFTNNDYHNLAYDPAGQLVSDQVGSGSQVGPYGQQIYYAYDLASNRTGVNKTSSQTLAVTIGTGITIGDV